MNFETRYYIGQTVQAKNPKAERAVTFRIGQVRIMTLADQPNRWLIEYRAVIKTDPIGWAYRTWYPEGWILKVVETKEE